jgi:hypothetical protein
MATQFNRYLGIQHLFQPGEGPCHQGRVGNPVIPADRDIDRRVRLQEAP